MTSGRVPPRSRWTYLAFLCLVGSVLAAGCIGGNVSEEAVLEVDRPTDADEACSEVKVLRDSTAYAPRLVPFLDHGKAWPIELRAGEAVKISLFQANPRDPGSSAGLPDLTMADPEGSLLLEKTGSSTHHHRVPVETNGTHEITVENPHLTEGGEWSVEIRWYPDIECVPG